MDTDFYRIRRLPPYVFAEVNAMKAAARGARRGHRRPRHGQSRRRAADACHRQARRSRGQAQRPPLFREPRHPGPAQGPGRLLPAPLRSHRRSRQRKSSSPWARRRASPTSPRRSPRPATSCSRPTRATRSTPSASSSPAPRSARSRPRPATTSSAGSKCRCTTRVPRPKVLVVGYPSNPTAYVADLGLLRAAGRLRARATT